MGGLALVCFRLFFLVVGDFGLLWEVVGYFDNSVQCWKVLGGFGCL